MGRNFRSSILQLLILMTLTAISALFLFGCYRLLVDYQSVHSQQRQDASVSAQGANSGVIQVCVNVPGRRGGAACAEERAHASADRGYAEADLRAQQEMAEWAFVVMLLGAGSFVTTVVGIFLLWLTLKETREALLIERRVSQPLLVFRTTNANLHNEFMEWRSGGKSPFNFVWKVRFVNRGKTPAIIVGGQIVCSLRQVIPSQNEVTPIAGDNPTFVWRRRLENLSENVVPPEELSLEFVVTPFVGAKPVGEMLEGLVSSRLKIYVLGHIIYRDIFENEHETGFAYAMHSSAFPHPERVGGDQLNYYRPRDDLRRPR